MAAQCSGVQIQSQTKGKSLASRFLTLVLSSPGGFTGHEHQADGPDEKETGVHGSSSIKPICSWCLLVTEQVLICIYYQVIIKLFEFAHVDTLCCMP